jgi:FMN phosphatase YigB (HAD superfamily)
MPKSLYEYADWLAHRDDLIWPVAPPQTPRKAIPSIKPLPGIRAVTWNVYGTLLRITDGELLLLPSQQLRMQVALEKTIQEFNMWQSMTRKAGPPWEHLLAQYKDVLEELRLTTPARKGDTAQVDSVRLWRKLISRLEQKEYTYDTEFYGDPDEFAEKVAYFFHSCLQGIAAMDKAAVVVKGVAAAGFVQGLLADGQSFTLTQLLRAFQATTKLPPVNQLFSTGCVVLSYDVGVKKPSRTLFETAVQGFRHHGIPPGEVLYVSNCWPDDLTVAKEVGFRTALFAGDKNSLRASAEEILTSELRPDRLITELTQIRSLLGD